MDQFVNGCCQDGESSEKESMKKVLHVVSKYKREKVHVCLDPIGLHVLDAQCLISVCLRERERERERERSSHLCSVVRLSLSF